MPAVSRLLLSLLIATGCVAALLLMESCANIVPPLGGPKDTLPPRIVAIMPGDSSLHFKEKKIIINFDEYVQLDNVQQNLIVSPTPKSTPGVESRLKTVTVRIKDTLEENTTYAIDFGKAIRDVNENNPLKDFRYVFSTGGYLDSMQLQGQVLVAETGKKDSTLIVMLHRSQEDSAVVKEKPRYWTRVDSTGHFHFQNLQPGTYAAYALKDESGSLRYMSPEQLFAFADSPIIVNQHTQPLMLYAYAEPEPAKTPGSSQSPKPGTAGTREGSRSKRQQKEETEDRRLKFTNSLESNSQDLLKPLILTFADSLVRIDSSKLLLTDEKFQSLPYTFTRDTTGKNFTIGYAWPLDQAFHLIIEKDMAADSLGKTITKNDTIAFRTMKESDYGSVRFRFTNLDTAKHPVLQLLQSGKVIHHYVLTGRELLIRRFRPAEFEMSVLYDENGNEKWDYGQFFVQPRRQPEKVQPISRKLTVKGNWDNEVDITL
ncbi:MAG: Ig-like domain-containing domain [Flavihumibacter sp.]